MWEYIDIPTIVTGIVVVLFQEIWNDIKYIFRLLSNRIFKKNHVYARLQTSFLL